MAVSEIFRIKETVLFSLSVMSDSLWPLELQHARLPCPSPSPRIRSYSCPLNWWCHPIISSCHLLLLLPSVLPSIRVISIASALQIRWSKYWSFSFSISPPVNTQEWSPLGWKVGSPCSSRDSQESSPTPQFKSINTSMFSFLYSPTLTSIHDYWQNHSLDKTDVCWQSSLCFLMCCLDY